MQRLKALLPLLKNRFVLVGLVFLVWMVFFDISTSYQLFGNFTKPKPSTTPLGEVRKDSLI